MGTGSSAPAEMKPVIDLTLEKVNACAKFYFDNDMDFGLNSAGCVEMLTKGAGLTKETADKCFNRFADPENPAALFSSLDFLGAATVCCQGDDETKYVSPALPNLVTLFLATTFA